VGEITIRKKRAYGIETVSPWIFVAEGPGFEPGLTGPELAMSPKLVELHKGRYE